MAVEIANAVLNITPSLAGLSREIDRQMRGVDGRRAGAGVGEGFTAGFKGAAAKLTAIIAGAFAAVKIKDFASGAIAQASDMEEVGTKLQAIYGEAAGDIEAFGARGAKALGQTSLQAKNAAATFGTFGKAAGLSAKENAAFSTQLATLATDMASFSNTTPEQAIEALGAGLRGESEPLRAYGVLLDDASLRQEALAMGLITTTKEALTPQQKVLASHALILKQTGDAQGDFERTSGGLANQQRILAAQWEDSKGKLGAAFLPGVTAVVSALNEKLFPVLEGSVTKVGEFASGVKDTLAPAVDQVWGVLSRGDFTSGPFAEDSPFVEFLFKIRDVGVDSLERFQVIWDKVKDAAVKMWPSIKSIAQSLGEATASVGFSTWDIFLGIAESLADSLSTWLVPSLEAVADFMRDNPGLITTLVAAYVGYKTAVLAINVATTAWTLVQAGLNAVMSANPIMLVVAGLAALTAGVIWAYNNVEWFRNLIDGAWNNVIKPVFDALVNAGIAVWDWFSNFGDNMSELWSSITTWISDAWNSVIEWFQNLPGTVWDVIVSFTGTVTGWGGEFIGWLRDGIVAGAEAIWAWFASLPGRAWDALLGFVGAAGGWMKDRGSEFVGWITDGITTGATGLWNWIIALPGKAWEILTNLKNIVVDIGKDFVHWIVDGIKSAAQAVADAVSSLFNLRLNEDGTGYIASGIGDPGVVMGGSARGGVIPGRDPGRRDNVLGRLPNGMGWGLRSEEAVMVPQFTHAVGGAAGVHRLNRFAEAGRLGELMGGFAFGGVVPKAKEIGRWVSEGIAASVKTDDASRLWDHIGDDVRGAAGRSVGVNVDAGSARGRFIAAMLSQQGTSYVWGAAGPNVFDCSGLISWALEQAGVGKGRLTAEGFNSSFPRAAEAPGNLVTFDTGRLPGRAGHIGAIVDVARGLMMHTDGAGPARISDYRSRDGGPLSIVDAIGGGVASGASNVFSGILSRVKGVIQGAWNNAVGPSGEGVPQGAGVERWRSLMADVLAKVGAYKGLNLSGYTDRGLMQINSESSGRENVWNTTDSNARKGTPSGGLLQVIRPTFEAALRGTPFEGLIAAGLLNPRANLTASTLYSLNRYGSLDRAWQGRAYAKGGIVPDLGGGTDSVRAWLTPGEGVFTPSQTDAIITHARAIEAGYGGGVMRVEFAGDGPLTEAMVSTARVTVDGALVEAAQTVRTKQYQAGW